MGLLTQPIRVPVGTLPEIRRAEETARRFAASIGFASRDCEEIALVVTELASNLVKHAGGGTLHFAVAQAGDRTGIAIESEDAGPGIQDFEQALTDGYSTAGSLGAGLGAVNRLMDALELRPSAAGGAHIACKRWLRVSSHLPSVRWLEFGVATRARGNAKENGDAFIVHQWDGYALAGVIDGLGHGPLAQRAAQTARQYVERHFDQPLEDLFHGAGRACRATRGVVMALARFDLAQRTFSVANIGNIAVRVVGGPARVDLNVRRGIVGLNAPRPVTTISPWAPANLLVMHSDGVQSRWDWRDLSEHSLESADAVARRLLSKFGSAADDATVLVVKGARS